MSAAATAAGYLYAHGQLPASEPDAQGNVEPWHRAAKSESFPRQVESKPLKQVRPPRIEYRKRRFYALPSAA